MAERRIAVITGSSAGIGRAAAIAFGRRGWRVALLSRGAEGLEGARRDVELVGGEAMVIETDVADPRQVEDAAARVEAEWGPIDVWINNAMATIFGPFLKISPEDFRRATDVTYLGAVWGTQAAMKRMAQRDRGTIVQVGSALAYRSIPLQSPYCGAKSALRGFTDSLRSELMHDRSNVHITMVQLSAFNTPQFDWGRNLTGRLAQPIGKTFQPDVAGEAIYWAAIKCRREVWVGFPAVQAILGTRVAPGLLDWFLAGRAYDGQQADEPLPADYRDNLYHAVPGDHGRRGRFSDRALPSSLQFRLAMHRGAIAVGSAAVAIALGVWLAAS
jgi:NAD(P)-dependent dehydrogenase (short-subunit alcohol dehydrogenase family)